MPNGHASACSKACPAPVLILVFRRLEPHVGIHCGIGTDKKAKPFGCIDRGFDKLLCDCLLARQTTWRVFAIGGEPLVDMRLVSRWHLECRGGSLCLLDKTGRRYEARNRQFHDDVLSRQLPMHGFHKTVEC